MKTTIRREPTYLSTEVWRALWLIAKSRPVSETTRIATPDEVADDLLREAIAEKYPSIVEHQKRIEELEKKLLGELKG